MEKYNSFYFHSVRLDLQVLESILKSGYILSREKAHSSRKYANFNGNKWISLCKYYDSYDPDDDIHSAFQQLVVNGISIVLDNNIKAFKTAFMSYDSLYDGLLDDDSYLRFSDCIDEYQVRDQISKSHFLAIMYPYQRTKLLDHGFNDQRYQQIQRMLDDYQYQLPIIDSSYGLIDNGLDKLVKQLKR